MLTLALPFFLLANSFENPPLFYPGVDDNRDLTEEMKAKITPHLLPLDHPIKEPLDLLFTAFRVTETPRSFLEAGFVLIDSKQGSLARVARHPAFPGYVFKLYLDTDTELKKERAGWRWLVDRCIGAKAAKAFIQAHGIRFFKVPTKWLYPLPKNPKTRGPISQPVILIAEDMRLVSASKTKRAWKELVTKEHLNELFLLLSNGFGSSYLTGNIPYSKRGYFTLIDTEYVGRDIKLSHVKPYLSKEMQKEWEKLLDQHL